MAKPVRSRVAVSRLVIAAFNTDLGYDDFVRRQLAADLYEAASPHDLVALGFLGLSPTYWKELRLAPEVIMQIVADEWDERIDAVSRTFQGLTVSCARCHDHKYDPVTMQDYYALAASSRATQVTDRPLLPPDAAAPLIATRHKIDALKADLAKDRRQKVGARDEVAGGDRPLQQTPGYDGLWAQCGRGGQPLCAARRAGHDAARHPAGGVARPGDL